MTVLWCGSVLLPEGWAREVRVTLADGRIVGIAAGVAPQAGDERHAVVIPGLPNLHSHAFQRAMAGLSEVRGPAGDSFWTWRDQMYRAVDRLDPEDVEAIAALAYVEMLEAGFTRVGEFHYLHHDRDGTPYADIGELSARIAAAASSTGIALTLLPVFYAHGGFGGAAPGHGQRRFINDVAGFGRLMEAAGRAIRDLPDAVLGLAPHSLRAATAEEIAAILPLTDGPIHIHVAEQMKEVEDCLAFSGARPVDYLYDHAPVDERWCLIHATHMTEAETQRLAKSGAVAGLCPITEANLGDGIFPGGRFAELGGRYGVGSDSNVRIDAAEELRLLEYSQRFSQRARNVMALAAGASTGRLLFDTALAGGTQALGAQALGSQVLGAEAGIAVGRPADLVSLDAGTPSLHGKAGNALIDGWIFAGGAPVDAVWRNGAKLVEGGRHQARAAVEAGYRRVLDKLAG
ncbi:formimidoylglutamate deiminase [Ancylobacter defluvii]|uniref:Formimidoylglutamate deiminase n=1 Tax=Ancylobacter defluvii TaxID=1282440 RepID=A0A9W6JWJ1_9HYPH|nr:formimidoylglutamate deiminase [Ancylobacter defluvii]MBS7590498.1 formimidoylglutamate deiminase [Ancylobacter defluvii]GLK83420.1 formimidoylglutamate deiminase [Ancylobacter defluvii]